MKGLFLILSGIFLLGIATVSAEEKVPKPKDTRTMHMKIEGMTCSLCSAKIKKNLKSLCTEATINHKKGEGSCVYEEGKTKPEQIVKAIEDAGFKGSIAP